MSTLLAIDPGNVESGWVLIDAATRRPLDFGKDDNEHLLGYIAATAMAPPGYVAIEMVASYGMPVGAEVFETCVWIGRFVQAAVERVWPEPALIKRLPVKVHHCHSARASDANVRQALVDRFALGVRNHGKGTKAEPGWFYGFSADVWSAYALAVYAADEPEGGGA